MAKNKRVMTTKSATEKYGLNVEYYRKLMRQGKLDYWSSNPKYFWEDDLLEALENEKQSNKTELLKWN